MLRRIKYFDKEIGKNLVFLTNNLAQCRDHCQVILGKIENRTFFQMDKTTPENQKNLWYKLKYGICTNMDGCEYLPANRHYE